MTHHSYDLAIVGSGSAAFAGAIWAREHGARVVMIERGTVGGTYVNIGCVPSKMLLRAAETFHHAGHHPYQGVETKAITADYGAMVAQKNRLTGDMRREKYTDLIDEYGWDLVEGEARFVGETTVQVGARTITAGAYLIATGVRPAVPPIPGLQEAGYFTSTTAMELDRLPTSIAVIGAGYIALEQGQVFRHLGSEVTIMQRGPRLLPTHEPEVTDAVGQMLARLGTRVLTSTHVQRVERTEHGRRLIIWRDGREETLEAEEILVATGRQPNIEALDLNRAGVAIDRRGAPVIDDQLRTTNPRVFAAGDVTLAPQFVYVVPRLTAASHAGSSGGIGATIPDFNITQLDGQTFDLGAHRGRVVALYDMAGWCSSCLPEAHAWAQLYAQYHQRGVDLLVVSVDPHDTPQTIATFQQDAGVQGLPWAIDTHGVVTERLHLTALDQTFILDRAGHVAYQDSVPTSEATLRQALDRVLQAGS
ncbi:MAG: FAD-dependent oxidoreductase [Ardenticatenaceae bacterium]|nr:FAD-dependent oxidoreductase [Ardenticatenaceae bacterium]